MLLCESNRAVQQNKTLMIIEKYILEILGSDNRVYIVILDSVAFVWQWQPKPHFAIAMLLTKNVDDNRSKHSVRTKNENIWEMNEKDN